MVMEKDLAALFIVLNTLSNSINPAPSIRIDTEKEAVWIADAFYIKPVVSKMCYKIYWHDGREAECTYVGVVNSSLLAMSYYLGLLMFDELNMSLTDTELEDWRELEG